MRAVVILLSLLVALGLGLRRPIVYIPGLGGSKLVAEFFPDASWPTGGPMTYICGFDLTTLGGRVAELWPQVRYIDDLGGHLEASVYCRAWLLQLIPDPLPVGDFRVGFYANVTAPGFGEYGVYGVTNFEVQMWLYGYVLGGNYRTAYWDWRQTPALLDVQYGWMDNLKTMITEMVTEYEHPVVVVGHSSGNHLAHYFLTQYLDSDPGWKADNIHWYVCVASGLGGFSAALGCGAFVINAAVTAPAAPDSEFARIVEELFLIGTTPFMIWSQPQTQAWGDIVPYYFEDGGDLVPETCGVWPFEFMLTATNVNAWTIASPENTLVWPQENFFNVSPGVDSTVICGYGLPTESTLVYESSTGGLFGVYSLQPTEFVITPGVDGDSAIPEQVCNCTHVWEEDTSITVEKIRFLNVTHENLLWSPKVVATWIFHAVEAESSAFSWNWFWSGVNSGVLGRK